MGGLRAYGKGTSRSYRKHKKDKDSKKVYLRNKRKQNPELRIEKESKEE